MGSRIRVRNRAIPGRLSAGASRRGRRSGGRLLGARSDRGAETGGSRRRRLEVAIDQAATREGAVGLDKHGISARGIVWWNLAAGRALRARARRGRRHARRGRPARRLHRRPHRARAQGQVRGPRAPAARTASGGATSTSPSTRPTTRPSATRLREHLSAAPNLYVIDAFAGADPTERLAVRVVSESAWHALFAQTMFIVPSDEELAGRRPRGADPPRAQLHRRPGQPTAPAPPTSSAST